MEIIWPSRMADNVAVPEKDRRRFAIENEKDLITIINSICQPSESLYDEARAHLDSLMKPPQSLGALEGIAARLYAIRGGVTFDMDKRCVLIFCGDNGVAQEGVASAPQEVTAFMAENFTKGLTGVCALAKAYKSGLRIIDVGIKADMDNPLIENKKVMKGTNNFAKEKAMSREQCLQAIISGIVSVYESKIQNDALLGIGEMGIGNTTTAAAVLSALTGKKAREVAGKGAGLSDEAYEKKINIIDNAVEKYNLAKADVIDIISSVGGPDIAAMTGAYIGAAFYNTPVVADGFISSVAALCAAKLCPASVDYIFLSHKSEEKGYETAANEMGLSPCLDLNMRLGEGSGCPIMFSVMDGALSVYNEMGTFAQGNISDDYVKKVRKKSSFEV